MSAMPGKSAPAFRIPADLERGLQETADRETRSISQIRKILLRIGEEQYRKEGPRFHQCLTRCAQLAPGR